jgi:hypothetical protein
VSALNRPAANPFGVETSKQKAHYRSAHFQFSRSTLHRRIMKKDTAKSLRAFAVELVIYALLVTAYFFLVLHLLGEWLYHLETQHRVVYAAAAILLIAGQAVGLDAVTTLLFRFLRRRWR